MYAGSSSNQRNRRESPKRSVTLDDVRREIQAQLNSMTVSQLCSPQDKICLPGEKGEPGSMGPEGRTGKFTKIYFMCRLLFIERFHMTRIMSATLEEQNNPFEVKLFFIFVCFVFCFVLYLFVF